MSWILDKERLQTKAREIDPSICLVTKNNWFWKALSWALFIVSFGKMERDVFLSRFATTMGNIQAYPESWSTHSVEEVMIHESRHTYQARICGFGIHPLVGLPIMGILYFFLPIPFLFAFFRTWFEIDADKTLWKYLLEKKQNPDVVRRRALCFAETISGPSYAWSMLPMITIWWVNREVEKVIKEYLSK